MNKQKQIYEIGHQGHRMQLSGATPRSVHLNTRTSYLNYAYISIASLLVYGDIVKRLLPGELALASLYTISAAILLYLFLRAAPRRPRVSSASGQWTGWFLIFIVSLYLLQFLTSFSAPLLIAAVNTIYICTPLAYAYVILRFHPEFDMGRLGAFVAVFMVPQHIVGTIQYFVSGEFMVASDYTESGGVIERDLFEAGSFFRYPALFVTADRYSAMSLVQVYLALFALFVTNRPGKLHIIMIGASLAAGCFGLVVSGARSRIVILAVTLASTVFVALRPARREGGGRAIRAVITILGMFFLVLVVAASFLDMDSIASSSLFKFFALSIERSDFTERFWEGTDRSLPPDDVTWFGKGLGMGINPKFEPDGRPGEFAIMAMWIESGLFWTPLMLIGFLGVIWQLTKATSRTFVSGDATGHFLYLMLLLIWVWALLAGLQAGFDLSMGIAQCIALGCVMNGAYEMRSPRDPPLSFGRVS